MLGVPENFRYTAVIALSHNVEEPTAPAFLPAGARRKESVGDRRPSMAPRIFEARFCTKAEA